MRNGFSQIIVIILLVLVGAGAYFLGTQNNIFQTLQGTPSPTSTPDPTANWKTYKNEKYGYSFKYPEGLKSDTGAAGQGTDSIRFTYIGEKQIASGRIQTELFDGYSFVVTDRGVSTINSIDSVAQNNRKGAMDNCPDTSKISTITSSTVAGKEARTYYADCMGSYTEYFVSNGKNVFVITQVYVGEEKDQVEYKRIIDQILSTFRFTPTPASPTPTPIPAKTLNYKLPSGWRTAANQNQDFEVGFNPQTMKADSSGSTGVWIQVQRPDPSLGYMTYASVSLQAYGGGSRHNFIYDQLGYTAETAKSERTPSYTEKNYSYNGWSCLVLYGLGFSASGTTWGMCPISSSQALFIEGPGTISDTETLIQTIKLLK